MADQNDSDRNDSDRPPGWSDEEIRSSVTYHAPSDGGIVRHAQLSDLFETAILRVRDICPPGRERSLVKTALEEAKMWASAAVARNPDTV